MQIIPLAAVPSQAFGVTLGAQLCQINIYTEDTGLYLDLAVNNVPLVRAVICMDRVKLVREAYLGFLGDLVFEDTQGLTDPVYTGLGARYQLVYLEPADL